MARRRRDVSAEPEPGLIDWHEPARNAHILDWRERAREFGLLPDGDDQETVVEPPDRLIQEEEPEALESQPIDEFRREETAEHEEEAADGSGEDVDLVRVYLKQIGRRLVVSRETLLRAERTRIAQGHELTRRVVERLAPALQGQIARKADRLDAVSKLFDSLNYKSVLKRGFALVRDADGQPLNSAEAVLDGQALVLEFADGKADATGGRIGTRPRVVKPKLVAAEAKRPASR